MKLIIIIIINIEKKMVQNLKWATAHLSSRLGVGLGARHSDTARRRGARHAGGRWAGVGAGGRAGHWALSAGRRRVAGVRTLAQGVLALGVGAGARAASERQRRWGTQAAEARRRWGAQASGTKWARRALAGAWAWATATRGERGGARGGRLGGLCASGVCSWARLGVLVHLTQFLAWFDSVFS